MSIKNLHNKNIRYQVVHAIWYLIFGISLVGLQACNEDEDRIDYSKYYDWRDQNLAFTQLIEELYKDNAASTYFSNKVNSLKEPRWDSFFHYVHKADLDSLAALSPRKDYRPFSTSTVSVHYTLFDTKSVYKKMEELMKVSSKTPDEAWKDLLGSSSAMDSIFFANAEGNTLKADTLESAQVTFLKDITPNSVIIGWGDILQQMYIGDHVVAYIPWFIAYGQKGSLPKIDPYTDLFFRIELCDITNWGGTEGNIK